METSLQTPEPTALGTHAAPLTAGQGIGGQAPQLLAQPRLFHSFSYSAIFCSATVSVV